jgi:spermidine synthase
VLVLYVEATTYAFTVMLATVLIGIAAGSYLVTLLMRRRVDWLMLLAFLEVALAFAVLLSLLLLSKTFDLVSVHNSQVIPLRVAVIASFLAMFPATLLMGVAFPVGLRIWASGERETDEAGRRVGAFYSLNVAGGILGSIVAAFVLVPSLGTRNSVIALSVLALVSGLLVVAVLAARRAGLVLTVAAVTLFAVATAVAVPDPYAAALKHRYPGEKLLWQDEGVQTTVSIHKSQNGSRTMYIDGLAILTDEPESVQGHRDIGALPMALHPNPKEALVVGLGGGATAGIMAIQHGVHVDVVELSQEVVDGSKWFRAVNYGVGQRRNVDIRVDDGRNYLLVESKHYDVITADITLPTHAGAGKLWSTEYWRLARDALKNNGVMLQWIGSYKPDRYKMIVRSFLKVFPNTTLWGGNLLVGTKQPLRLDREAFERKLQDPATREALATVGLTSFDTLTALYSAGPDALRKFVGDGPVLTDDRPRLEYYNGQDVEPKSIDLSKLRGSVDEIVKGN